MPLNLGLHPTNTREKRATGKAELSSVDLHAPALNFDKLEPGFGQPAIVVMQTLHSRCDLLIYMCLPVTATTLFFLGHTA